MKKLLLIALVLLSTFSCKNNSPLNSEYKELLQIQKRQKNKIQQLKSQKEQFISQINSSKQEIKTIVGNTSQSYSQVSNNVVLENKLKLIQRRLAYANKLNEFENQTFQALQVTNFTLEDIKDKIALGSILGKNELNQILSDIDKIKNTALPETDNLALNIDNSELRSFEDIWNNFILKDEIIEKKTTTKEKTSSQTTKRTIKKNNHLTNISTNSVNIPNDLNLVIQYNRTYKNKIFQDVSFEQADLSKFDEIKLVLSNSNHKNIIGFDTNKIIVFKNGTFYKSVKEINLKKLDVGAYIFKIDEIKEKSSGKIVKLKEHITSFRLIVASETPSILKNASLHFKFKPTNATIVKPPTYYILEKNELKNYTFSIVSDNKVLNNYEITKLFISPIRKYKSSTTRNKTKIISPQQIKELNVGFYRIEVNEIINKINSQLYYYPYSTNFVMDFQVK